MVRRTGFVALRPAAAAVLAAVLGAAADHGTSARPARPTCPARPARPALLALRGGAVVPDDPAAPLFVRHRLEVLERARARAASGAGGSPIVITLPDGATKEGTAGVTTPLSVAAGISKQLAAESVVALVDGELWDMSRPLTGSCSVQLLPFDDPRAQAVFWSAFVCLCVCRGKSVVGE